MKRKLRETFIAYLEQILQIKDIIFFFYLDYIKKVSPHLVHKTTTVCE